jgi:serine/threonine protein kinase
LISLSDCRAVLLDFGAAKKLAANTSQAFSVIVTPGYAPLEQYATRARRGAFTDVYALCATLYHALSGQTPPSASDRAIQDDLIPLRELRPEVPLVTARAIEAGLRTEIARRPQSIAELRDALNGGSVASVGVAVAPSFSPGSPGREQKADELKSRQRSILSHIQSINDTAVGGGVGTPPSTSTPNASSALASGPLTSPYGVQRVAQQTAQEAARLNASGTSGVVNSTPPLPVARSTAGHGAGLSPQQHLQKGGLRNTQDANTWRNGVYAATIGITLLAVIPGLVILNAMISRPEPPATPPIEVPAPKLSARHHYRPNRWSRRPGTWRCQAPR